MFWRCRGGTTALLQRTVRRRTSAGLVGRVERWSVDGWRQAALGGRERWLQSAAPRHAGATSIEARLATLLRRWDVAAAREQERSHLNSARLQLDLYEQAEGTLREAAMLARTEQDAATRALFADDLSSFEKDVSLRSQSLVAAVHQLVGAIALPEESDGVLLEIRAHTGGEDCADFAATLLGMYFAYAKQHSLELETLELEPVITTGEALSSGSGLGYRKVVAEVKGSEAWKQLRWENGSHRFKLKSAKGPVQTSFVDVLILPLASDTSTTAGFDPKDVAFETFKSSGPGGQHANVTESAVRATHLPTGIKASVQTSRSQLQNRQKAVLVLKARVAAMAREAAADQEQGRRRVALHGERIRTYEFHRNRVIDHRTKEDDGMYPLGGFLAAEYLSTIANGVTKSETEQQLEALLASV